jgi:hypothetical protein
MAAMMMVGEGEMWVGDVLSAQAAMATSVRTNKLDGPW